MRISDWSADFCSSDLFMRITAYAERLLRYRDDIDWPEAIKEMQRNWIGRSEGAMVRFELETGPSDEPALIEVFTTRPDTIFGCTFLVLAPEHELVNRMTTDGQREEVAAYVKLAKNRSARASMAGVKTVSGAFTVFYSLNPFTAKKIQVSRGPYI